MTQQREVVIFHLLMHQKNGMIKMEIDLPQKCIFKIQFLIKNKKLLQAELCGMISILVDFLIKNTF
jgi:hypothetical protein